MKKLLLAAAIGLFGWSSAQIQKGNYMVGGELAAARFGLNDGAGYQVKISPNAAYFVQDNWAVGGYVDLGFSGAKNVSTSFDYGVGALSRYYFSPGEGGLDNLLKHGRFYVQGKAGIGGQTTSDGGDSANGLDLGFGPGYTYFITENIGLDASINYNGNLGFGNRGTTSNIDFRLGLNIFLPSSKAMSNIKDEN